MVRPTYGPEDLFAPLAHGAADVASVTVWIGTRVRKVWNNERAALLMTQAKKGTRRWCSIADYVEIGIKSQPRMQLTSHRLGLDNEPLRCVRAHKPVEVGQLDRAGESKSVIFFRIVDKKGNPPIDPRALRPQGLN